MINQDLQNITITPATKSQKLKILKLQKNQSRHRKNIARHYDRFNYRLFANALKSFGEKYRNQKNLKYD